MPGREQHLPVVFPDDVRPANKGSDRTSDIGKNRYQQDTRHLVVPETLNGKYVFDSQRAAFDHATAALKKLLIKNGYERNSLNEWIK